MHQVELMMALLIASTALAGLTAVFMGQVAQASREKRERARRVDIITLLVSFAMFLGVIVCSINWFNSGNPWYAIGTTCFFPLQIVAFTLVFVTFWLNELKWGRQSHLPTELGKLTTKNDTPQRKRQPFLATNWAWILVLLLLASILAVSIFAKGPATSYALLRDILTIVIAIAGVAIAAGGYLVYRLISERAEARVVAAASSAVNTEILATTAHSLAISGYIFWVEYELNEQKRPNPNSPWLRNAISLTQLAWEEYGKKLDERKYERLICGIKNNLAFYLAERGCTDDRDTALTFAQYIHEREPNYPRDAPIWLNTYTFVMKKYGSRTKGKQSTGRAK